MIDDTKAQREAAKSAKHKALDDFTGCVFFFSVTTAILIIDLVHWWTR